LPQKIVRKGRSGTASANEVNGNVFYTKCARSATRSAAWAIGESPSSSTLAGAGGQVEIVHHVDRKAAYHTCFACDDLAAGD